MDDSDRNDRYDITVAYRVCGKMSSHKPPIHADSKLELVRLCAQSFASGLGGLKAKMLVILAVCGPEYEDVFREIWPSVEFLRPAKTGDGDTLRLQTEVLSSQNWAEVVYFAEDDYFYLPGTIEKMLRFQLACVPDGFVTPYFHPDMENTSLHQRFPFKTLSFLGTSWRSSCSTTHTFMTTKAGLSMIKDVFLHNYGSISPDLTKWLAITKPAYIWNPFVLLGWCFVHRFWAFSVLLMWWHCWRQVFWKPKMDLWVCEQPMATHMVKGMLAKGFEERFS